MSDALVSLLNRYGYQPVFLPRTGVAPPELYNFADHRLIRRGALTAYFPKPVEFKSSKGRLADLEGQVTSGKDLKAAVGFLQNALGALGIASLPRLDLSFAGSKQLVFAFTGVTNHTVDPAEIDRVLQDLAIPLAVPDRYVETGALHVAYDYAYATGLTLRRADGRAFGTDVGGSIAEYVDVGVKARLTVDQNSTVSFTAEGGEPAAFAYKAGRLQKQGERWTFEPEVVMRRVRSNAAQAPKRGAYLPARSVVLRAEEED